MLKAVPLFKGKVILSKWIHSSPFAGKLRPGALDFILSLPMKLLGLNGVYLPLVGKPIQIQPRTATKDGFVVFQLKVNGIKWMVVHINPTKTLKLGVWYKAGTRVGTMDPHPINATGPHFHLHMFYRDNSFLDLVKWYAKRGVNNWFSDPFHLQPKP